jgi:hypothetical protein
VMKKVRRERGRSMRIVRVTVIRRQGEGGRVVLLITRD